MKFITPNRLALVAMLVLGAAASSGVAVATPKPNRAVVKERIFNDCPSSVLTIRNQYPALISINDAQLDCFGFANLHVWRLSRDGDPNPALFDNNSCFSIAGTLTLSGTGKGEAGLQIRPWWAEDQGRLQVRVPDGEIAAFGGVLPFYSFTGSHGITYTKGNPIYLAMIYRPECNTSDHPATMEYQVRYLGVSYTSGPLAFNNCNASEEPIYGCYGILNQAQVGGVFQPFMEPGNSSSQLNATWRHIAFHNCTGNEGRAQCDTVETSLGGGGNGGNEELVPRGVMRAGAHTVSARSGARDLTQRLSYQLATDARVQISVFDLSGRMIKQLVSADQGPGQHAIEWDVREVPSGVYFYRFLAGRDAATLKFVLVH